LGYAKIFEVAMLILSSDEFVELYIRKAKIIPIFILSI
jgi:hypothetical protein